MIGVVLHYYGSPQTLADVRDFYARIVHREPSEEKVARLIQQYRAYGRPAPLGATVERIERFLEERLNRVASLPGGDVEAKPGGNGRRFMVRRAGKHAPPWVHDVVREMVGQGVSTIVSLPLTPFGSRLGTENYHRAVRKALEEHGKRWLEPPVEGQPTSLKTEIGTGTVRVIPVERWYLHELFVQASELRLRQALSWLPEDVRRDAAVVFTIHSMPEAETGEPPRLPEQYRSWARETARRAGLAEWTLSYRSAPAGNDKWLGPDVRDVIREVAAKGAKAVVVCPVPTLIENVEVFHDAGEDAQGAAGECGLEFVRTEMLNDSADMLDLLESLVWEALGEAAIKSDAPLAGYG